MTDWFYAMNPEKDVVFKENFIFLKGLQKERKGLNVEQLQKIHTQVFAETDCISCARCCKTTPPIVTETDIRRLATLFNISSKQFIKKFVMEDVNGDMNLNGVPCRFLNADGSCSVYESRPEACRRYPHTDEPEFFKRPELNAKNTVVCPAAFRIVEKLKQIYYEV